MPCPLAVGLADALRSIRFEGDLFVSDKAVDGRDSNHDRSRDIARHCIARRHALKKCQWLPADVVFHGPEKVVERASMIVKDRL